MTTAEPENDWSNEKNILRFPEILSLKYRRLPSHQLADTEKDLDE